MRELAGERTVVLSTHILREVEALCDRVVMIYKGQVVAAGTLDEVRQIAASVRYEVEVDADAATAATAIGGLAEVATVEPTERGLVVRAKTDPRPAIASLAHDRGWAVRGLTRVVPTLEEAFLAVVEREG